MKSQQLAKYKVSDKPGVYFFKKGENLLYIGKATSLKDRVRSYFGKDLIQTRGPLLVDMVFKADKIDWQETDSVLEALILEANLIKKHQPYYNTREKDDKSWNYVCISRENIPRVFIVRGKNLIEKNFSSVFGPFTQGGQLKVALKIIRRVFPFIDSQSAKKNNKIFYHQLDLSPGTETREAIEAYKKNLKNLKLFFQGKKKRIIANLKKEMMHYAKGREFEKAGEIKRKIFALEHINDVALIKEERTLQEYSHKKVLGSPVRPGVGRPDHFYKNIPATFRVEAYDIAHMSGKNMVGVMTVVENGEVNKTEYRMFKIKTQNGANDTGALEEVLMRRFRHTRLQGASGQADWGLPDLVVVDGSTPQINVAKRILSFYKYKIPVVSVVKDERHKAKAIMGDEKIIKAHKSAILLGNSEAHRFAITFHKKTRNKNFLPG